jgi:predicted enzyme related to lactoylglutathione lyase
MKSPAILFEIVALNRAALVEFYTKVFGWPAERSDDSGARLRRAEHNRASWQLISSDLT